jgi:hypothetical protein
MYIQIYILNKNITEKIILYNIICSVLKNRLEIITLIEII